MRRPKMITGFLMISTLVSCGSDKDVDLKDFSVSPLRPNFGEGPTLNIHDPCNEKGRCQEKRQTNLDLRDYSDMHRKASNDAHTMSSAEYKITNRDSLRKENETQICSYSVQTNRYQVIQDGATPPIYATQIKSIDFIEQSKKCKDSVIKKHDDLSSGKASDNSDLKNLTLRNYAKKYTDANNSGKMSYKDVKIYTLKLDGKLVHRMEYIKDHARHVSIDDFSLSSSASNIYTYSFTRNDKGRSLEGLTQRVKILNDKQVFNLSEKKLISLSNDKKKAEDLKLSASSESIDKHSEKEMLEADLKVDSTLRRLEARARDLNKKEVNELLVELNTGRYDTKYNLKSLAKAFDIVLQVRFLEDEGFIKKLGINDNAFLSLTTVNGDIDGNAIQSINIANLKSTCRKKVYAQGSAEIFKFLRKYRENDSVHTDIIRSEDLKNMDLSSITVPIIAFDNSDNIVVITSSGKLTVENYLKTVKSDDSSAKRIFNHGCITKQDKLEIFR